MTMAARDYHHTSYTDNNITTTFITSSSNNNHTIREDQLDDNYISSRLPHLPVPPPLLSSGDQQRSRPESGYSTASPATTISPAPVSTPSGTDHALPGHAPSHCPQQGQHFVYDELAFRARTRSPRADVEESEQTSPHELSPCPVWSDSQVTQFHMESDGEDAVDETSRGHVTSSLADRQAASGLTGFAGFTMPAISSESDEKKNTSSNSEDDEEDVFYTASRVRQWNVASEPHTPRYRSGSLSLRTRRYCTPERADDGEVCIKPQVLRHTPPSADTTGNAASPRSLTRHEVFTSGRSTRSHSFSALSRFSRLMTPSPGTLDNYEPEDHRLRTERYCRSPGAEGYCSRPRSSHVIATSPLARPSTAHIIGVQLTSSPDCRGPATEGCLPRRSHEEDTMFSFDQEDIEAYHSETGGSPESAVGQSGVTGSGQQPENFDPNQSYGFPTRRAMFYTDTPSPSPTVEDTPRRRLGLHPQSAPVLIDRPPQSPASQARRRRRRVGTVSLSTHVRLSGGQLIPCASETFGQPTEERSVSTQTPHATSVIIQQLISTPAPLPSSARGTAADRLRYYSDGSPAWPGFTPLPDIVPTTVESSLAGTDPAVSSTIMVRRRDRSASAPDLMARAAGREAGRELRRLSDEFYNTLRLRRNLSPVRELQLNGHPASFPRMRRGYFRHVASHFGAFLSETFGVMRGSSVDLDDDVEHDL